MQHTLQHMQNVINEWAFYYADHLRNIDPFFQKLTLVFVGLSVFNFALLIVMGFAGHRSFCYREKSWGGFIFTNFLVLILGLLFFSVRFGLHTALYLWDRDMTSRMEVWACLIILPAVFGLALGFCYSKMRQQKLKRQSFIGVSMVPAMAWDGKITDVDARADVLL